MTPQEILLEINYLKESIGYKAQVSVVINGPGVDIFKLIMCTPSSTISVEANDWKGLFSRARLKIPEFTRFKCVERIKNMGIFIAREILKNGTWSEEKLKEGGFGELEDRKLTPFAYAYATTQIFQEER